MNFLGHLYFSNNDIDLMYANLFGDFVKGKDLSRYEKSIQQGIILHREIDHYIDHHPIVLELLHELYPHLPKIAGIAVDLYFDHILAKEWNQNSSTSLSTFIADFEKHNINEAHFPNERFLYMLFRMKKGKWLSHYSQLDGLDKACRGVSQRISFPNTLFNGKDVFVQNEEIITNAFHGFMKEAKVHFSQFINSQEK